MTYKEARNFIEQSKKYGSKLGLETVTELLFRLGNPQDKLKLIHVAGTNGKGSTTAFLTTILAENGYKAGRYISPAVFSYREIIQISCDVNGKVNTENIKKESLCAAITLIKAVCEAMVREGLAHPTSFEIETAMAMLYFLQEQVDIAVIEAGLGGRLDATNVIKNPLCCIITSVSLDHMQYLGDTLEAIAAEKAGIIKEGRPLISSNRPPEVLRVLEEICNRKNAPFLSVDNSEAVIMESSAQGSVFCYHDEFWKIKLPGMHQLTNALLAIRAVEVLKESGFKITREGIRNGLAKTIWNGRFEVISKEPYFVIDGAHNEEAANRLTEAIQRYFNGKRLIYILGVFADKDYHSILRITAPLAGVILTISPENSRALPSEVLAEEARKYCSEVIDVKTVRYAVETAYRLAAKDDVILAFGSLSFLGEIKSVIDKKVQTDRD